MRAIVYYRAMLHDLANAERKAAKRWAKEGHHKRAVRALETAAGWYWYLSERAAPRSPRRRRLMWLSLGCDLRHRRGGNRR